MLRFRRISSASAKKLLSWVLEAMIRPGYCAGLRPELATTSSPREKCKYIVENESERERERARGGWGARGRE